MTDDRREIHRKKRILEYAERVGNINKTFRYFGVARSTFYLWSRRKVDNFLQKPGNSDFGWISKKRTKTRRDSR